MKIKFIPTIHFLFRFHMKIIYTFVNLTFLKYFEKGHTRVFSLCTLHSSFQDSSMPKIMCMSQTNLYYNNVCRFDTFELMLKYWTGPVTAVAYVTDEEVLTLTKKLQRSENIQNRSNIVYHIVYKRHVRNLHTHKHTHTHRIDYGTRSNVPLGFVSLSQCCFDLQRFFPINYVRNVALRNTHTAYSIFVDVDLVPNKKLYKYLKQYITNNPHDNVVSWFINEDLYYRLGGPNPVYIHKTSSSSARVLKAFFPNKHENIPFTAIFSVSDCPCI